MRFIFGLIVGAVITLLVATALDAPTNAVLTRAQDGWQSISTRFNAESVRTAVRSPEADASIPDTQEIAVTPPQLEEDPQDPDTSQVVDRLPANTSGEAVVWAPFHSEASATGFANRLSRQLAHPFEVRKQGPANYVVVYGFNDETQRLALQQQISKVTGVSSS